MTASFRNAGCIELESGLSQGVRVAVDICMSASEPQICFWGIDFATVYNDAFAALLALPLCRAVAEPLHRAVPDLWIQLVPALNAVMRHARLECAEGVILATADRMRAAYSFVCTPLRTGQTSEGVFCHVRPEAPGSDAPALHRAWRYHSGDVPAAHAARRELMHFLTRHAHTEESLFEAELIIGELIANVVEHAPGYVDIVADWRAGIYPCVRFRDYGPGFAIDREPQAVDAYQEDGRGLYVIKTLSKHFTVAAGPGYGSEVAVVLPVMRRVREQG